MRVPITPHEQVARKVILVRPVGFGYSKETAATNGFQQEFSAPNVQEKVGQEFDELLQALVRCGIGILLLDPKDKSAPDAVFPNNWFSTDEEGRIVLYPMAATSRRTERDPRLGEALHTFGFANTGTFDLSQWEEHGLALEGTGSMVLDRKTHTAYAALSPRTSEQVLNVWCKEMKYEPIAFTATMDGTKGGQPIYHTNVLMSIGERFAVVCMEAIPDLNERHQVAAELAKSGRELIQITLGQMHTFAGNILQLRSEKGDFIFLSEQAHRSLQSDQIRQLGKHGDLVPVAIPTIETIGGGSVRCMLAENFLPLRS
ncbi:MAG: arginine deiminase-related protein [Flavobacteriales bacterium]